MIQPQTQSILLITDPKILAVAVQENQEPLLDIKSQTVIQYGTSPEIPDNQDYTFMRKAVYEKLLYAQSLLPNGIKFCLYEGYRSLALQKFLFDTRYEKVKLAFSDYSATELFIETTRLVSPITHLDGSTNIPPHATGAAIDVYLLNEKDEPLEMGIHPAAWMEDVNGTLSLTESTVISALAKQNRALMATVLEKAGFVNYPTEYWHWSYGDKYWAYHTQHPHAIYGLTER